MPRLRSSLLACTTQWLGSPPSGGVYVPASPKTRMALPSTVHDIGMVPIAAQWAGGLRRTTSTTAPTMSAPPPIIAGVSRSFRMSEPSRTAITGFTYA